MFWFKKTSIIQQELDLAEQCRIEAEMLYRTKKYHCAEAVLEVIRKRFSPQTPECVLGAVSGFGGGSGSGCICGALSGGTVAIGLVLHNKKQTIALTRHLHTWFREQYGAACCATIRAGNGTRLCPDLTGAVAGKIAEMLSQV
jgi:C_GCAxxG_C_C family probable redox protein